MGWKVFRRFQGASNGNSNVRKEQGLVVWPAASHVAWRSYTSAS